MKDRAEYEFLNPMSEMMVLSDTPACKNVLAFGVVLEGTIDRSAMQEACVRGIRLFPHFWAMVKEIREGRRWKLAWAPRPDLLPDLKFSEMDRACLDRPFEEAVVDHLEGSFNKDWDLFANMPSEFHLIRTGPENHVLFFLVHHGAVDAFTGTGILEAVLKSYEEIVTGQGHENVSMSGRLSSMKSQQVQLDRRKWWDILRLGGMALDSALHRYALPKFSGDAGGVGHHHAKTMLSREETGRILETVRRDKISYVDYLVAAVNRSVDLWNESFGIRPGLLKTNIVVQMRGKYEDRNAPVNMSTIAVVSRPEDRSDPQRFIQSLARERKDQIRNQLDVKNWHAARTLSELLGYLKLPARKKLVEAFMKRGFPPLSLSYVGIMWPELKDGKPTGASTLTRAGGLKVTEALGFAHALAYDCPVNLVVKIFSGRLDYQVTISKRLFTLEETRRFGWIVGKVLVENPFVVS